MFKWIMVCIVIITYCSTTAYGSSRVLSNDDLGTIFCGRYVERNKINSGTLAEVPAEVVDHLIQWCDFVSLRNLCTISHSFLSSCAFDQFDRLTQEALVSLWHSFCGSSTMDSIDPSFYTLIKLPLETPVYKVLVKLSLGGVAIRFNENFNDTAIVHYLKNLRDITNYQERLLLGFRPSILPNDIIRIAKTLEDDYTDAKSATSLLRRIIDYPNVNTRELEQTAKTLVGLRDKNAFRAISTRLSNDPNVTNLILKHCAMRLESLLHKEGAITIWRKLSNDSKASINTIEECAKSLDRLSDTEGAKAIWKRLSTDPNASIEMLTECAWKLEYLGDNDGAVEIWKSIKVRECTVAPRNAEDDASE